MMIAAVIAEYNPFHNGHAYQLKETGRIEITDLVQKDGSFIRHLKLLILAGAGSGKTRVLTHRIAYLIAEKGVNPWNILAITFTNKAAHEMRERVDKIAGSEGGSVWVSTFHSTCVRILRRHIDRLGYDNNFTIYDADDQKTLIKEICRKMNIDTKKVKERALLAQISHATSAHSQKGPRIVLGLIVRAETSFIHNSHLLYSAQYTSYPSGCLRYPVASR